MKHFLSWVLALSFIAPLPVTANTLAAEAKQALADLAMPEGALAQRFELAAIPPLEFSAGSELEFLREAKTVGAQSMPCELRHPDGRVERFHLSFRRHLLVAANILPGGVESGEPLTPEPSTTWVENERSLATLCQPGDGCTNLLARRRLAGGHALTHRDTRPTPVVRRGDQLQWISRRGNVVVRLTVRSRGEAPLGGTVVVESPLDRKLRRMRVLAPGLVGDEAAWAEREELLQMAEEVRG